MILGLHTAKSSSTAILYFTRSADLEARRKSLVPNDYRRNQKVVKALIDHTESTIRKTGLSYFLSDSDSDSLSFGQKLTQNIDHVFAQGYTNVIILGNDCPTLSQEEINTAANILSKGHDTYGRSSDGGLYLIGLQQESYHRAIFEKLAWSRETLAEDLDKYLATYSREIHCVASSIKLDIDDFNDFQEFVDSKNIHVTVYHKIVEILFDFTPSIGTYLIYKIDNHLLNITSLRGPPQVAA